ncbi:FkbM family methyltransferase [Haloarcula montana]|uniref:FkbM family methyltransferase n=1 Tax=Haloarcula montana TaxID=3111776 RepID=UPI002D76DB33|nr:FkbM family methyltransferase [Haloarcula sp. GH36]
MAALDPVYQRFLPETFGFSIDSTTAKFDTQGASLAADFRYSFQTERPIIEDVLATVESEDTFYDVGANIGLYSCFVGQTLTTGTIIAFEPHPEEAKILRKNLKHNGLPRDAVHRVALSDSNGLATLRTSFEGAGHAVVNENTAPEPLYEVDKRVGDEYITTADLPSPSVVKIDVEGLELPVIEGFAETLSIDTCRVVYAEYHPSKSSYTEGELVEAFETLGFSVEILGQRRVGENDQKHLKATKAL